MKRVEPQALAGFVEVRNLSKRFSAHGRSAFEDVSFSVPKAGFTALIGPSGCGKSTLLHIMAGLSPATSGEVRLHGEIVNAPRSEMMFVFQQYTKSIFPWKTVLDNVMLALKYRSPASREEMQGACMKQLEVVGLARYAHYH